VKKTKSVKKTLCAYCAYVVKKTESVEKPLCGEKIRQEEHNAKHIYFILAAVVANTKQMCFRKTRTLSF
jgi:hypothetical protein